MVHLVYNLHNIIIFKKYTFCNYVVRSPEMLYTIKLQCGYDNSPNVAKQYYKKM